MGISSRIKLAPDHISQPCPIHFSLFYVVWSRGKDLRKANAEK